MAKVSIILPVYKVENYIKDCVSSIIAQTFKDFELIIVDDSSPDRSISIAKELLSESDIDFKVIQRLNGGLSAARNTGISFATGDYLVFVDSDDVIVPDYLETLYNDVSRNNVDLAIACFNPVTEETKFNFDRRKIQGKIVEKKDFLKKVLKRKIFNYFGCFMISREYITKHNLLFDESVFFGVDQAYMWQLMVKVERYTFNQKKVYNYFDRPNSIMTGTKIDKMLTGLPSLIKCAKDISGNPYFDSKIIVTRWKISTLHTIAKTFDYNHFKEAKTKFRPSSINCLKYPDYRIKAVGIALLMGDRISYIVLKKC